MAPVPIITNCPLKNKFIEGVAVAIAGDYIAPIFEEYAEATFIGIDGGLVASQAGFTLGFENALSLRGLLTTEPAEPELTFDEVKANPAQAVSQLKILTPRAVEDCILKFPAEENTIRRNIESLRARGARLAQNVANVANADTTTGRVIRAAVQGGIDLTLQKLDTAGDTSVSIVGETAAFFLRELQKSFNNNAFARPRRSGDRNRVSKEPHEYEHATSIIKTYGSGPETAFPEGASHVDVAVYLILNALRAADEDGNKFVIEGDDYALSVNVPFAEYRDDNFNFRADRFTFGNFVDGPGFRKFVGRLKSAVQDVRSKNVKSFIRDNTGQSREDFLWDTLLRMPISDYIGAIEEYILLDNDAGESVLQIRGRATGVSLGIVRVDTGAPVQEPSIFDSEEGLHGPF